MSNKTQIDIPRKKIAEFCHKWQVREFSFFGSVLRDDFRPKSDIDVMVEFEHGTNHSLFDLAQMAEDLKDIFGREVDIVTRKAVEESRNYIRRKEIMCSREVIYVA